jgi:short subunit dehydrogenase-like uncharacterized protein
MTAAQRELDIVLYGATGFVGKLTTEYLARSGGAARIGLAGRSAERLLAVRESLGEVARDWPLIVADAASPSSLNDMAARTRVVVTTGPVASTVNVRENERAVKQADRAPVNAATIHRFTRVPPTRIAAYAQWPYAHACGLSLDGYLDSIPSDLTVYALFDRARRDGAGQLGETNFVMRAMAGGVSGGTVASMIEVMSVMSADPRRDG